MLQTLTPNCCFPHMSDIALTLAGCLVSVTSADKGNGCESAKMCKLGLGFGKDLKQ
jgi:hypothetical protein